MKKAILPAICLMLLMAGSVGCRNDEDAYLAKRRNAAQAENPNYVEIPDAVFRAYLKKRIPEAFSWDQMDANSESVKHLEEINVYLKDVKSLQGIAYFTDLKTLDCPDNQLRSLDVSHNAALTGLILQE